MEEGRLSHHEVDAALHDMLLVGLHVGHAVHHEAADAVGALKDCHAVAHLVQLVCGRKAGRTAADDGHGAAGAHCRRPRHHPSHLICLHTATSSVREAQDYKNI